MRIDRRHGALLLAVAVWNVLTFGMFARNLYNAYAGGEDRPTGYWVAHTILIVVNFAIAAVLGRLGLRIVRGSRTADEQTIDEQTADGQTAA